VLYIKPVHNYLSRSILYSILIDSHFFIFNLLHIVIIFIPYNTYHNNYYYRYLYIYMMHIYLYILCNETVLLHDASTYLMIYIRYMYTHSGYPIEHATTVSENLFDRVNLQSALVMI